MVRARNLRARSAEFVYDDDLKWLRKRYPNLSYAEGISMTIRKIRGVGPKDYKDIEAAAIYELRQKNLKLMRKTKELVREKYLILKKSGYPPREAYEYLKKAAPSIRPSELRKYLPPEAQQSIS